MEEIQYGISMSFAVYKEDGTITQEECDAFMEDFLLSAEAKGWLVGGSYRLLDTSKDLFEEEEIHRES